VGFKLAEVAPFGARVFSVETILNESAAPIRENFYDRSTEKETTEQASFYVLAVRFKAPEGKSARLAALTRVA